MSALPFLLEFRSFSFVGAWKVGEFVIGESVSKDLLFILLSVTKGNSWYL